MAVAWWEASWASLPAIRAGFANQLKVIVVDNIGWGKGDRPTFEYSLSYFADFIRELQDALGYTKTTMPARVKGSL